MEKRITKSGKQNSHLEVVREITSFESHHTMAVVGIPDVVVRESVDVGVKRAVIVDVHVSNEELVQQAILHTIAQIMND